MPLTAVEMPLGRLGAVAVDALIDQIEGQTPQDRLLRRSRASSIADRPRRPAREVDAALGGA